SVATPRVGRSIRSGAGSGTTVGGRGAGGAGGASLTPRRRSQFMPAPSAARLGEQLWGSLLLCAGPATAVPRLPRIGGARRGGRDRLLGATLGGAAALLRGGRRLGLGTEAGHIAHVHAAAETCPILEHQPGRGDVTPYPRGSTEHHLLLAADVALD